MFVRSLNRFTLWTQVVLVSLFYFVTCAETALAQAPPPTSTYSKYSNPTPTLTTSTNNEIVLRKELYGYPDYGVADHAADILYSGEAATWDFPVAAYISPGAVKQAYFRVSMVADDHGTGPATNYYLSVWANNGYLGNGPADLPHGTPPRGTMQNWVQRGYQASTGGSIYTITLQNTSEASGSGPPDQFTNWIAVDWIELHLMTTETPPPTVTSITPSAGLNNGTVNITNLAGTGFLSNATVMLTQTGQADILGTSVIVASPTKITCTFDLAGAATGQWDVVVTNTDGQSAKLPSGFTVNAIRPDLLIKLDSEPDAAYAGDNVYESTPLADQTKSQTVQIGHTANCEVKIENDGNTTRTFLVKAVESTDAGWSMAYTKQQDGSVAANITTTGYTTASLAPGASEIILVQMTPGNSVVGGASKSATLEVFLDGSDATVRDSVKAVTTVKYPAPTVTSITPSSGLNNGSVSITNLAGTGFLAGATVKLATAGGDIAGTNVAVVHATQITCTFDLTGKATGAWNVVVTNSDGQSATLANGFTINNPPPTVTGITPNSGLNNGTVNITNLAGAGFLANATVKLMQPGQSDINATNVAVVTSTNITCAFDLTGKTAGQWNVVVTNPDGQSGTLTKGFTINNLSATHDVALTTFTVSPNPVAPGSSASFNVTVKNLGTFTENGVTFTMNYGNMRLAFVRLPSWKPGQEMSGVLKLMVPRNQKTGDYLITGQLSPVAGETNTGNNNQTVKLTVGSSTSGSNPFAGTWRGTWRESIAGIMEDGTIQITVATNGNATGSDHNNTENVDATISCTVDKYGNFTGTTVFPIATYPMQGTMSIASNGHLVGNFTQTINGVQYGGTFDMTRM